MAVETSLTRYSYTGNNSASTPYPIPFVFLDVAHIKVVIELDGDETTLSAGQFTATRFSNGQGQVVTTQAWDNTYNVIISRVTPKTQPVVLEDGSLIPAKTLERGLDRLAMQSQEIQEEIDSFVVVPHAETHAAGGDDPVTLTQAQVTGLVGDLAAKASSSSLSSHTSNTSNPHSVTKAQVGLSAADNTADADKPVSTAQATALAAKQSTANLSTDVSADATSDVKYPSVHAVKTYADALVTGLIDDRGNYDASGNVFPSSGGSGTAGAILKGDLWLISVAGTLGGTSVLVGSSIRALVNTPGQTAGNWGLMDTGLGYTAENAANKDTDSAFTANSDTKYPSQKAVKTALTAKASASTVSAHIADVANPHSVTKTQVGLGNCDNTSDANKPVSTAQQAALDGKADLVGGFVPSAQLPSYVDDVLEYADFASLPGTGETGKIYVTLDDNTTYRWSGSIYVGVGVSAAAASQAEMEAGTEAGIRSMSPLRVAQAIAALAAGGSGASILYKHANYTAVNGDIIAAVTGGGVFTITLPASPADGETILIYDAVGAFDTQPLTVDGNGIAIDFFDIGPAGGASITLSRRGSLFAITKYAGAGIWYCQEWPALYAIQERDFQLVTIADGDNADKFATTKYVDSTATSVLRPNPAADGTYPVYNDGVTSGQLTSLTFVNGLLTAASVIP